MWVCDEEAFVTYNFAPLSLRRSIGILGFFHKRILGTCHPALIQAFPMTIARYHNRTIDGSLLVQVRSHRAVYNRSIWPYVHIYNCLSQGMVDHRDVKSFQAHLTQLARYRANVGEPTWREAFQSEIDVLRMCH